MELAAASGARVFIRPLIDFADQRNFGVAQTDCEWILHLDADERVTHELWDEIVAAITSDHAEGFQIPELNIVFGAPLRHGGWYPQYHLRLYRRNSGIWSGSVNETAGVEGRIRKLRTPIVHSGHPDIHAFLVKMDRYTSIEAKRINRPVLQLGLLSVAIPAPYFLYKYGFQRGILDGWRGLAVAVLLSVYKSVMYLKAIEWSLSKQSGRRVRE